MEVKFSKIAAVAIIFSLLLSSLVLFPKPILAVGINTIVDLPVSKGLLVYRTQLRWLRATGDPTQADRDINVLAIPNIFLYGVTEKLAVFGILPYIFRNVEFTNPEGKRVDKDDNGIGDARILGRYSFYEKDYVGGTTRFALLGGIKLPIGDDDLEPITTDSIDFSLGGVSSVVWDFARHEVDVDILYNINTEAGGFEKGDTLNYDLAYALRVYPWTLPEVGFPNFLNLVVEANGTFSRKSERKGKTIDDSGGNTIFLSPGLQFITKNMVFEASIQLPIIQDLNGNQVETDFVLIGGIRVALTVF